jgi:hypothetical protein
MTDMDNLADRLQPGVRWAQSKLKEVSDYLDAMGPTLRAQSGWQPIETAPKDGTIVLGWEPRAAKWKIKFIAFQYMSGTGFWFNAAASGAVKATHWMPLPEGPK